MKYFKVTYVWWCSVVPCTRFVQAETEENVWKNFEKVHGFGYEDIDIKNVEEVTLEELLKDIAFVC